MPETFAGLMKRRHEERIAELEQLLARAQREEQAWTLKPERLGGLEAQKIRTRAVRGWTFELKELKGIVQ